MNTRFLFPHSVKRIGWLLLLASIGYFIVINTIFSEHPTIGFHTLSLIDSRGEETTFFNWTYKDELTDEILASLFIIGAVMVAFSKEKNEDEFIAKIRLESLLWATYINYGLLLMAILFVYGFAFFDVMLWNLFTLLVIFLIRFYSILYSTKRALRYEK